MRDLKINRADAEFLTDLLMLSDHYLVEDLDKNIRDLFGMISVENEGEIEKSDLFARVNFKDEFK